MNYTERYLAAFHAALSATQATTANGEPLPLDDCFERLCALSGAVQKEGRTQFMCGNGASAAFANHMALDWSKNGGVRTMSFSDSALLTALVNDLGENEIFAAALRFYSNPGDLLVTISSSGNSPNILAAIDEAQRRGLTVVTFSGLKPDNQSRRRGSFNLYVPARTYGMVECAHEAWLHAWLDRFTGVREWERTDTQNMRVSGLRP